MGPKPFLMNQWYVCAREQEITRTPMTRWICGEPLVFFRRENGSAVALSDRCPHRKYPLSKGHLIHDEIECGYHGLRFGPDGACRLIPAQNEIPPGFGVHAYPLVEQYGMVFVWMGDRARADVSLIPNYFEAGGAGWACDHDYIHLDANWQLIIDNLLDLTHLTFVHKTTLASPGIQENPLTVTVEGDTVRARREMYNVEPAPVFHTMRHFEGNIDRFQNLTFLMPNHVHIRIEACPAGAKNDPDLVHHVVLNHLTPETERTTHYFWTICRRMRLTDVKVADLLRRMNRTAFEEDAVILRHQQQMMNGDPQGDALVNLDADKAVSAVRRIIRRKLQEEAGTPVV